MTTSPGQEIRCSVLGAENLPAETGGADAVCAAIRSALQGSKPASGSSVTVTVRSPYSAAASISLSDGRVLTDVNVASSDRSMNQRSIAMLAEGVARQVDSASER